MHWGTQHLFRRAAFNDAPQIHHAHLVRKIFHDAQVVGNEEEAQPQFLLQRFQQIQYLRLHRHIQRAGGLIADQQLRRHRQGPGNGDSLALTARELMRIAPFAVARQTDFIQHLIDMSLSRYAVGANIERTHALFEYLRHAHLGIERSIRILEHHLHRRPRCAAQFLSSEPYAARSGLDQLQQRLAQRRLAATGFAYQRQRTALRDVQRHPVHRLHLSDYALQETFADGEVDLQVFNLQED